MNQHAVASWIYQTVATVAPDFAGFLHNEGFHTAASTKNFKFFVFSLPKLPHYTFADGVYCFDQGDVQLQITSPLPNFLEAFVMGLTAPQEFRLGGQRYVASALEILEPPAFHEKMRFAALSPLTVSVQPHRTAALAALLSLADTMNREGKAFFFWNGNSFRTFFRWDNLFPERGSAVWHPFPLSR